MASPEIIDLIDSDSDTEDNDETLIEGTHVTGMKKEEEEEEDHHAELAAATTMTTISSTQVPVANSSLSSFHDRNAPAASSAACTLITKQAVAAATTTVTTAAAAATAAATAPAPAPAADADADAAAAAAAAAATTATTVATPPPSVMMGSIKLESSENKNVEEATTTTGAAAYRYKGNNKVVPDRTSTANNGSTTTVVTDTSIKKEEKEETEKKAAEEGEVDDEDDNEGGDYNSDGDDDIMRVHPKSDDVLFGTGTWRLPGNRFMLKAVDEHATAFFDDATVFQKENRRSIIDGIIAKIHDKGGRFLRRKNNDDNDNDDDDERWVVVARKVAYNKVRESFYSKKKKGKSKKKQDNNLEEEEEKDEGNPKDEDILFGREKSSTCHPGNQRLIKMAKNKATDYRKATVEGKRSIIEVLFTTVSNNGGRFLRQRIDDDISENKSILRWTEVSIQKAEEKIRKIIQGRPRSQRKEENDDEEGEAEAEEEDEEETRSHRSTRTAKIEVEEVVIHPTKFDVIIGSSFQDRPGNKTLLHLVETKKDEYFGLPLGDSKKRTIIDTIIDRLARNGGRFLRGDNGFLGEDEPSWTEVSAKRAVDKVRWTFDRCARTNREISAQQQQQQLQQQQLSTVPLHEEYCRKSSFSSIGGSVGSVVWARLSYKSTYWPSLILGMIAPKDKQETFYSSLTERNEYRLTHSLPVKSKVDLDKKKERRVADGKSHFLIEFLGDHSFAWVSRRNVIQTFDASKDPNVRRVKLESYRDAVAEATKALAEHVATGRSGIAAKDSNDGKADNTLVVTNVNTKPTGDADATDSDTDDKCTTTTSPMKNQLNPSLKAVITPVSAAMSTRAKTRHSPKTTAPIISTDEQVERSSIFTQTEMNTEDDDSRESEVGGEALPNDKTTYKATSTKKKSEQKQDVANKRRKVDSNESRNCHRQQQQDAIVTKAASSLSFSDRICRVEEAVLGATTISSNTINGGGGHINRIYNLESKIFAPDDQIPTNLVRRLEALEQFL